MCFKLLAPSRKAVEEYGNRERKSDPEKLTKSVRGDMHVCMGYIIFFFFFIIEFSILTFILKSCMSERGEKLGKPSAKKIK